MNNFSAHSTTSRAEHELAEVAFSRNGDVVARKYAVLPARCVRCNAPAALPLQRLRLSRFRFSAHDTDERWLRFGLVGILAKLSLCVRRERTTLTVGLCQKHLMLRRLSAPLFALSSIASILLSYFLWKQGLGAARSMVGAAVALTIEIFVFAMARRTVRLMSITLSEVVLRGAAGAFVSSLPPERTAPPAADGGSMLAARLPPRPRY